MQQRVVSKQITAEITSTQNQDAYTMHVHIIDVLAVDVQINLFRLIGTSCSLIAHKNLYACMIARCTNLYSYKCKMGEETWKHLCSEAIRSANLI